jgi:hypothetical protein
LSISPSSIGQVVRLDMHNQTPADTGRKDFFQVVLENRLANAIRAIK